MHGHRSSQSCSWLCCIRPFPSYYSQSFQFSKSQCGVKTGPWPPHPWFISKFTSASGCLACALVSITAQTVTLQSIIRCSVTEWSSSPVSEAKPPLCSTVRTWASLGEFDFPSIMTTEPRLRAEVSSYLRSAGNCCLPSRNKRPAFGFIQISILP